MVLAALTPDEVLGRTLLALAVVVAVTRALTPVLRRLGQPAVLAQVLAGILLGPTLLGAVAGGATDWLFPTPVRAALSAIGSLGLVLFLFLMGLELDRRAARSGGRRLAAVTAGSLLLPLALGALVAATVLADRAPSGVGGVAFAAFVGTALSVSALPVLARLLDERDLTRSRIGQLVLASASIQDAAAWLLLAASLTLAGSGGGEAVRALVGVAGLCAALAVLRPLLAGPLAHRLTAADGADGAGLAIAVGGLLACAALTQLLGLHAALGALAYGVAFPRSTGPRVRAALERGLGPLVRGVLLPVYFLAPGLSFALGSLTLGDLPVVGLLLACAAGGKLVGAGLPALATGASRREAAAVGVLLNTRGLVELIVLGIGLGAGLIGDVLYTQLALVAIVTTCMTGPLLGRIATDEELREDEGTSSRRCQDVGHDPGDLQRPRASDPGRLVG